MKNKILVLALLAACGVANAQTQTTSTTTTTEEQPDTEKTVVVEKEKDHDRLKKGGFYWEPMVTYQTGKGTLTLPVVGDANRDVKGWGAGMRLGFHASEVVFIAADGRYSWLDFEGTDAKAWNVGPSVGVQMPRYGLRLWGTYVLAGDLDQDETDKFDVKFTEPNGWRLGAGIHVKSVSLNAEYQDLKYDKIKGTVVGYTGELDTNAHDKSWIASVSFPMEF